MNTQKLQLLENKYDVCGGGRETSFIYDASTPTGKCPMMKTLMTNKCIHDCKYCINTTKQTKLNFGPMELAKTFIYLKNKYYLHGLFLSSGIETNADYTAEKMLEAVKILRNRFHYKEYIHFKILPGTSYELIKQASQYVNRLSINIEVPSSSRMRDLSSNKDFKIDILKRQAWIKNLHDNQTTQFIVGANEETDKEILKMMRWEYDNLKLKRIYYSSFNPVKKTKLEKKKKNPVSRQNILYNVDFLYRKYGYKIKDFILDDNDNLPNIDPKLNIALNSDLFPLEINEANYEDLIKVPGIGLKTANKIIGKSFKKYEQLHKLGVLKRARPFIKVNGSYQKRL